MVKTNKKSLIVTIFVVLISAVLIIGGLTLNTTKPQVDAQVKADTSTILKAEFNASNNYVAAWHTKINYQITNLTITTNDSKVPQTYLEAPDVSETQDGSLKAYVVNGAEANTYDCIIYGDVDIIYAPQISTSLFESSKLSNLKSINFENFNTSNVTRMSRMFAKLSNLYDLNLSGFKTSNVTNMAQMFRDCSGLTSINLSSFDTSNVTDMSYMFSGCSSLKSINLSNFNTSNVTDMEQMFSVCSSLISLDLNNFNTSKVTNMNSMFALCTSLKSVNLSSFDTSNVTDMGLMFTDCFNITYLDLSNFETEKVATFEGFLGYVNIDGVERMPWPLIAMMEGMDFSSPTFYTDLYESVRGEEGFPDGGDITNQKQAKAYMESVFSEMGMELIDGLQYLDISNFTVSSTATTSNFISTLPLVIKTPKVMSQEMQLPISMYKEGTDEEVNVIPSTGAVLVTQPNKLASDYNFSNDAETPATGFDMAELAITTTLGLTLLLAVAVVFAKKQKKFNA